MIGHLFNRECEITPVDVGAADGYGGFSTSAGSPVSAMCRVQPAGAAERRDAERREMKVSHVVYLLADTAVERGDQIELQDGLSPTESLLVEDVQVSSVPTAYKKVLVSSGERSS